MKILVVGSNGMAGHMITDYLQQKNYNVFTVARHSATYCVDIEDTRATTELFAEFRDNFAYVINCVGLLVKDSNQNPDRATIVNAWFPHLLEATFRGSSTRVIHLSTDCVFDGSQGYYKEHDVPTETNFYGRSKSLGELDNDKDITLRMSIIGPEIKSTGTGLLQWILNNPDSELTGWDNALWNGMTTLQLAKCIEQYIHNPRISGIYHLVNNNVNISKYELLCKVNDIYGLSKTVLRGKGPKNINKILVDTRMGLSFDIPEYDQQLKELRDWF
jgi:dTDP-4-dehydrorhamnose reductase